MSGPRKLSQAQRECLNGANSALIIAGRTSDDVTIDVGSVILHILAVEAERDTALADLRRRQHTNLELVEMAKRYENERDAAIARAEKAEGDIARLKPIARGVATQWARLSRALYRYRIAKEPADE